MEYSEYEEEMSPEEIAAAAWIPVTTPPKRIHDPNMVYYVKTTEGKVIPCQLMVGKWCSCYTEEHIKDVAFYVEYEY
jgi:hypothetical protein